MPIVPSMLAARGMEVCAGIGDDGKEEEEEKGGVNGWMDE